MPPSWCLKSDAEKSLLMSKTSSSSSRSALEPLVADCRDEIVALDAAALIIERARHRARLQQQLRRRVTFRRDLRTRVAALGGTAPQSASRGARLSGTLRRVRGDEEAWSDDGAASNSARKERARNPRET